MSNKPTYYYNNEGSDRAEIHSKWWTKEPDELFRHVFGVVKRIREMQNYRSLANLRYARLYNNCEILGLQAGLFARTNTQQWLSNRVTFNVIQSCVDTAAAKLASAKPRPMFLTDAGDWAKQRRAELLTSFMDGAFDTIGTGLGDDRTMYGIGRRGFVDAEVFGTGATKFFIDKEKGAVKAERVMIEEIIVDDTEGMYGQPRQMHQEKLIFREVALDLWPDYEQEIKAAPNGVDPSMQAYCSADMIKVLESWHLPSGETATDGKHAISIETATVFCEDYKKDYFPFLFQRWNPGLIGFYGQGLAEQLIGIQLEINKLLRNIQLAIHLCAVPQVWLDTSSKIVAKTINNEIGGIKFYNGTPPTFMTPGAMSPEVYQHLDRLVQKAYEISGINQLSASGTKPAGINSQVAMREYQDIESERFQLVGLRYEDYYLDAARMICDMMGDLEKMGKTPKIKARIGDGVQNISWSDVKMDEADCSLRCFPTNLLPSTPAGKVQQVTEMMEGGIFTQDEGIELLDFPDTKAVTSLKRAPREALRKIIENMLDKGEYAAPEPWMNLQLAQGLAQQYYLLGLTQNMPEDRLEMLRAFMEEVKQLGDAAQASQAAQQQPQQGQPSLPAQAASAPVSDLLPMAGAQPQ